MLSANRLAEIHAMMGPLTPRMNELWGHIEALQAENERLHHTIAELDLDVAHHIDGYVKALQLAKARQAENERLQDAIAKHNSAIWQEAVARSNDRQDGIAELEAENGRLREQLSVVTADLDGRTMTST